MIGYFANQRSGCSWYRTKHVMDLFDRNGIKTMKVHLNEDVPDDFNSFQIYGAYPFSMDKVLKYMKEEKKRIVYDTDDALDLIDTTNPFFYSVKKDLSSAKEMLAAADAVTVSTPEMGEYVKPFTQGEITVVPNCYDPLEWTYPRPQREGFRIGFAGSSTHVADLIQVLPTIKKLQEKGDVRFLIMGFGEKDYKSWFRDFHYAGTPESQESLMLLDKMLSEIKFEWVPFVDFSIYPQTLTNMALDIGICPLIDTPFNRCRSACKAMEYTLSGALALASNIAPYNQEPTSILVEDWEKELTYYMENPDTIKEKHAIHLDWIKENRNITSQLVSLTKVYGA